MHQLSFDDLKSFLDEKADLYNSPSFIEADPLSIPHRYSKKEDIEIAGFLASTIAWGNRKSIITNANKMMTLMDHSPHDFVVHHTKKDLKHFEGFVHRTFNSADLTYFVQALQNIYKKHNGLENVFLSGFGRDHNLQHSISHFKKVFFEINHPERTRKHVSDPLEGSSAKRLNMYLRWMVRKDNKGVDLGIWPSISPALLSIPLDVHTGNISRKLGILKRTQNDQKSVMELDAVLRKMDSKDPVKYDFALFGLGAIEKF